MGFCGSIDGPETEETEVFGAWEVLAAAVSFPFPFKPSLGATLTRCGARSSIDSPLLSLATALPNLSNSSWLAVLPAAL